MNKKQNAFWKGLIYLGLSIIFSFGIVFTNYKYPTINKVLLFFWLFLIIFCMYKAVIALSDYFTLRACYQTKEVKNGTEEKIESEKM